MPRGLQQKGLTRRNKMLLAAVKLFLENGYEKTTTAAIARKAGMGRAQCTTVMLEVGMQNAALACSLGTLHFTPMAAVPGAIGGVVHQITGSLLASIFAARNGKQESAQAVMPEAEPAK